MQHLEGSGTPVIYIYIYIYIGRTVLKGEIQLNMFRASTCPLSGAQQLQSQPLVCRWNVVVAVLLVVVGPVYPTTTNVFQCGHKTERF
jgi:hypothetical protein